MAINYGSLYSDLYSVIHLSDLDLKYIMKLCDTLNYTCYQEKRLYCKEEVAWRVNLTTLIFIIDSWLIWNISYLIHLNNESF